MMPDISIIVCTHNRAPLLAGALASLRELATDGKFTYEIVVIDNASTDETPQVIAAAVEQSRITVRGVRENEKGIVPARNRGLAEARGRWIAFFDDDQLADPRWLAELYRGAQQKQCPVVGGAVHLSLPPGCRRRLAPIVRTLLGEAILADQPLRYGGRLIPGCGNIMVEREVFDEVGGFERTVDGRGEDTDLFVRIERAGISAWYCPTAIVHHLTPPERLETGYLLKLAGPIGQGVALRQAALLSKPRYAALWLAKAARIGLSLAPLLAMDWLLADSEAALGRRCLIAINAGFVRAGWKCLRAPKDRETDRHKDKDMRRPAALSVSPSLRLSVFGSVKSD